MASDCLTKGLAPYSDSTEMPWDVARVLHLYRRFGFSIPVWEAKELVKKDPQVVINYLIDSGVNAPSIPEPDWAHYTAVYYRQNPDDLEIHLEEWARTTITDMFDNPVRARLSLFWSNHFVTEVSIYNCPSYLYEYYQLFNVNGLGDFKKMAYDIGETGAMIVYLNSYENTKDEPNENYARELLELFTMGRDNNYTQQDIVEAARALTGYQKFTEFCAPIEFNTSTHDYGEKTIFGVTDNFDHHGLIDLIFDVRKDEVAGFICGKLFEFYVGDTAPEPVMDQLKAIFIDSGFNIESVVRAIAQSEVFFEEYAMQSKIKSPYDMLIGYFNETGNPITDPEILSAIFFIAYTLNQILFNPPSVEGWVGDKAWVDTSTITDRWTFMEQILFSLFRDTPKKYTELAKNIIPATTDPYLFTVLMTNAVIPGGFLEESDYLDATAVFKGQIPQNYYDDNLWNLTWDTIPGQVALLLQYLTQRPEYNLT